MIKYEELTPEQKEIWDVAFDQGYDVGWDEGFVEASQDETDEQYQYQAGYKAGTEAEQARIQYVLNMMFESSINMGQGNKAVQYKHAMELLRPIIFNEINED